MADIRYDPACMDCRRDNGKDLAGTTWQCAGHVRAERDSLRAKLANVMVEWKHDVEVLTNERNAALTLAEQRGAAYDIEQGLRQKAEHEQARAEERASLKYPQWHRVWESEYLARRMAEDEVEKANRYGNEYLNRLIVAESTRDLHWREVESLREWKDKLEAERDDIAAWAESWMKRVAAAERERDEARARLARIEEVTRDSGIGPAAAANNLARLPSPAPPADAAETPGTNKVEASDGDRDHKGADLKQDGGGNAADGEGPALLGVQQADGALPDGAAGRVLLAVSVLRGGAADRSVAPPADAAREALRYCEEVFQHNEINRVDGEEIADRALVLIRRALSTPAPAPSAPAAREGTGYPPTLADARMHVERLTRSLSQPHSADERFFAINEARTWLAKTAATKADAATEDNESGVEGVCRACDPLVCEEQGRWQKRIEKVISEAGFEPCDASGNESGDPLDYSADQIESALTHALHLEEADAATEAVREAKERLWDALDRESLGGTYLAARGLRAALSTPAPAPSTKDDTIEHPCGCYAPDGDVCRKHVAPSTHALRRCEQPEVKK